MRWPKIDLGDDRGIAGWLVPLVIAIVIGAAIALLSKCLSEAHAAEMPGASIVCDGETCTLPREQLEVYMHWAQLCRRAQL